MLESGLRVPTPEIISHLADKLHIETSLVRGWADTDKHEAEVRVASAEVETLLTLAADDLAEASGPAARLEQLAAGNAVAAWLAATFLRVLVCYDNERYDDGLAVLDELSGHWAVIHSASLRGRVETLRSVGLRVQGSLSQSADAARRAVETYQREPDWEVNGLAALVNLISALAELGRMDEIEKILPDVERGASQTKSNIQQTRARWVIGNVYLLEGDAEEGIRQHEMAFRLLNPDRNLRFWARLRRASASMRLSTNAPLDDVDRLLQEAETAFSLSSTPSDRVELAMTRALFAEKTGDWDTAISRARAVVADADLLSPQNAADIRVILGRALIRRGDNERGRAELTRAVGEYSRLGGYERAFALCQEWQIVPPADN